MDEIVSDWCDECGNELVDGDCGDCAGVASDAAGETGEAWRYAAALGYDAAMVYSMLDETGWTVESTEDGDRVDWEVRDGDELLGLGRTKLGASVAALRNRGHL